MALSQFGDTAQKYLTILVFQQSLMERLGILVEYF